MRPPLLLLLLLMLFMLLLMLNRLLLLLLLPVVLMLLVLLVVVAVAVEMLFELLAMLRSGVLLRRAGAASCSCSCCTRVVCFSKLIFKFPLSVVVAVRLTVLALLLTRPPNAGDDFPL